MIRNPGNYSNTTTRNNVTALSLMNDLNKYIGEHSFTPPQITQVDKMLEDLQVPERQAMMHDPEKGMEFITKYSMDPSIKAEDLKGNPVLTARALLNYWANEAEIWPANPAAEMRALAKTLRAQARMDPPELYTNKTIVNHVYPVGWMPAVCAWYSYVNWKKAHGTSIELGPTDILVLVPLPNSAGATLKINNDYVNIDLNVFDTWGNIVKAYGGHIFTWADSLSGNDGKGLVDIDLSDPGKKTLTEAWNTPQGMGYSFGDGGHILIKGVSSSAGQILAPDGGDIPKLPQIEFKPGKSFWDILKQDRDYNIKKYANVSPEAMFEEALRLNTTPNLELTQAQIAKLNKYGPPYVLKDTSWSQTPVPYYPDKEKEPDLYKNAVREQDARILKETSDMNSKVPEYRELMREMEKAQKEYADEAIRQDGYVGKLARKVFEVKNELNREISDSNVRGMNAMPSTYVLRKPLTQEYLMRSLRWKLPPDGVLKFDDLEALPLKPMYTDAELASSISWSELNEATMAWKADQKAFVFDKDLWLEHHKTSNDYGPAKEPVEEPTVKPTVKLTAEELEAARLKHLDNLERIKAQLLKTKKVILSELSKQRSQGYNVTFEDLADSMQWHVSDTGNIVSAARAGVTEGVQTASFNQLNAWLSQWEDEYPNTNVTREVPDFVRWEQMKRNSDIVKRALKQDTDFTKVIRGMQAQQRAANANWEETLSRIDTKSPSERARIMAAHAADVDKGIDARTAILRKWNVKNMIRTETQLAEVKSLVPTLATDFVVIPLNVALASLGISQAVFDYFMDERKNKNPIDYPYVPNVTNPYGEQRP